MREEEEVVRAGARQVEELVTKIMP